MKRFIGGLILLFIASLILASSVHAGSSASASSGSSAGALAGAGATSGITQVTNQQPVDLSRAVGLSYAPALTTTLTGTCMGSTSAGAGFAGGAFSIGSTWVDRGCTLRFNANSLVALGDVAAARAVMCLDADVRKAYAATGQFCPQEGVNKTAIRAESQRRMLALQKEFDARYNVPVNYSVHPGIGAASQRMEIPSSREVPPVPPQTIPGM